MSNLGAYQSITTIIKELGGPKKALGIILGGATTVGIVAGSFLPSPVTSLKKAIRKRVPSGDATVRIFTIHTNFDSGDQRYPNLHSGNQYRVLERDGDAVLIELLGDPKNPYFLSSEILESISNFATVSTSQEDK